MQRNLAKRHLILGEATFFDFLSALKQTKLLRLKWVSKALGLAPVTQPVVQPTQRSTPRQRPPAIAELPAESEVGNTLEVGQLNKGGMLQIITRNTIYSFRMLGSRDAILSTNQKNRPEGLVQLRGCTYGCAGSISPDRLFCGGNLEFSANTTRQVHITSEIKALKWLPAVGLQTAR
jgi:hypothetical protein